MSLRFAQICQHVVRLFVIKRAQQQLQLLFRSNYMFVLRFMPFCFCSLKYNHFITGRFPLGFTCRWVKITAPWYRSFLRFCSCCSHLAAMLQYQLFNNRQIRLDLSFVIRVSIQYVDCMVVSSFLLLVIPHIHCWKLLRSNLNSPVKVHL